MYEHAIIDIAGRKDVPVVPQKVNVVWTKLEKLISAIQSDSDDLSVATFKAFALDRSYDVCLALIPALKTIPRHEWYSFATAADMENPDVDPDDDFGPTLPEIEHAIRVAFEVNGLSLLKKVQGMMPDPQDIKTIVTKKMVEAAEATI